jgi:hypothetical protein
VRARQRRLENNEKHFNLLFALGGFFQSLKIIFFLIYRVVFKKFKKAVILFL